MTLFQSIALLQLTDESVFVVPSPQDIKTEFYDQQTYCCVAITVRNAIPTDVREMDSTHKFQKSLKSFLVLTRG